MKKYKTINVPSNVLESIQCDICKKEYSLDNTDIDDNMEIQEFHHINFVGGYGSVFGDMSTIVCDICQHCLKDKLGEHLRSI